MLNCLKTLNKPKQKVETNTKLQRAPTTQNNNKARNQQNKAGPTTQPTEAKPYLTLKYNSYLSSTSKRILQIQQRILFQDEILNFFLAVTLPQTSCTIELTISTTLLQFYLSHYVLSQSYLSKYDKFNQPKLIYLLEFANYHH